MGAVPHLKKLHEAHAKDGLVILGIHSTQGSEKCARFVENREIPYPVAIDVRKRTVMAFKADSFPDYYLVDRAGKLRFADLANGELDKAVALLLKEPVPTTESGEAEESSEASDNGTSKKGADGTGGKEPAPKESAPKEPAPKDPRPRSKPKAQK